MKYVYRHIPEIILLIYIALFFGFKEPAKPWDRVINSDGKGYYAYLPAIFIYHDLQFGFVEQYEAQYYPSDKSVFKEFRNQAGEKKVNKYFPGLAIIWLPFFLLGHLIAWLTHYPMDGYSLPYQYLIAISALMYLWLGARWLQKALACFAADERTAAFITLAVTIGTNLLFFTIVEASMTHVFSFTLITGFVCTSFHCIHNYRHKWFIFSLLLFILIVMIRPTNGLILLLVPFLAGSNASLAASFRKILREPLTLLFGGILAVILISIPFILWKLQTGQWLVYAYGAERLDILKPNVLNILFGFNRGWFIYTPMAFISLAGLIGLFRQNRYRFYWLLAFLVIFIYITSCWWVWYYASKCGQRVFIDIYVVVGILLLHLYKVIQAKSFKRLLSIAVIFLMGLNIFQFYQHTRWIYPPSDITSEIFMDSFLSVHQKARVYLPVEGIIAETTLSTDMETDQGWMNTRTRFEGIAHKGNRSSRTDTIIPYSIGVEKRLDSLFVTSNRIICVEAWILTPQERTEATLVIDFQIDGKSISYNPVYLERFAQTNRWTRIQAAVYVPSNFPANGTGKIYFYNPSKTNPFYVDDMKIDYYSLKDIPDYRKIEGIKLPE